MAFATPLVDCCRVRGPRCVFYAQPGSRKLLSGQNLVCPMIESACLTRPAFVGPRRTAREEARGGWPCYWWQPFRIELVSARQRCESKIKERQKNSNWVQPPVQGPSRIQAERLKTSSFKLFLILISFMINSDRATEPKLL